MRRLVLLAIALALTGCPGWVRENLKTGKASGGPPSPPPRPFERRPVSCPPGPHREGSLELHITGASLDREHENGKTLRCLFHFEMAVRNGGAAPADLNKLPIAVKTDQGKEYPGHLPHITLGGTPPRTWSGILDPGQDMNLGRVTAFLEVAGNECRAPVELRIGSLRLPLSPSSR